MKVEYAIERKTQPDTKVDRLCKQLGSDVVLLSCNGKKPNAPWKSLTISDMSDDEYLEKLAAAPNIGVVLGKRSGNLCVIDFDVDGEDETFLKLNPSLTSTLRTRGSRGSSFWVRIIGSYPGSTKLKLNGSELGEWRADGNQSIIAGLHPTTHQPYKMLNKATPVAIAFDKIIWPQGAFSHGKHGISRVATGNNVTQVLQVTEAAQVLEVSEVTDAIRVFSVCDFSQSSENEIVRLCVPNAANQNHGRLFDLARGVKTLERQRGDFSDADLKRLFGKWYRLSRAHLRKTQSRAEYLEEFLQACDTALIALDEGGLLTAWQMAKKSPQPKAALTFKSAAARMLVSLCFQLQQLAGNEDFFLSCHSAGKLLKLTSVHTARLLRTLVGKGVLQLVEKGNLKTRKATRYRFTKAKGILI